MKKRKKMRKLNHQQKREVAKSMLIGMNPKRVAAKWNVCLSVVYDIMRHYTVLTRTEKYPDAPELQPTFFDWLDFRAAKEPAE